MYLKERPSSKYSEDFRKSGDVLFSCARQAVSFMNADRTAAFSAGPPDLFFFNETGNTVVFNI